MNAWLLICACLWAGLGMSACAWRRMRSEPAPSICGVPGAFPGDTVFLDASGARTVREKARTYRLKTPKDGGWENRTYYSSTCRLRDSMYSLDSSGRRLEGWARSWYVSAQPAFQGRYRNGAPLDTVRTFHPNGGIHFQEVYPPGGGLGRATLYRPDGSFKAEGAIWNHQWVGLWIYRDELGRKMGVRFIENRITQDSGFFNTDSILEAEFRIRYVGASKNGVFHFYAQPGDKKAPKDMEKYLGRHFDRICGETGARPDSVLVQIHASYEDFNPPGLGPDAAHVMGLAIGRRKIKITSLSNIVVRRMYTYQDYERLVAHELSHIVLRTLTGDSAAVPAWLSEGLAEVQSGATAIYRGEVRSRLKKGTAPTIAHLEGRFYAGDGMEVRRNYQWSASLVRHILSAYGWEKLRAFARNPEGFEAAFGKTPEALSAEWHAALGAQFR